MENQGFGAFGPQPTGMDWNTDQVAQDDFSQPSNDAPKPAARASTGPPKSKKAWASCTLCRQRKLKCDRENPCANCVRQGKTCEPNLVSHAPRGRQGGRKKTDPGLVQRVSQLEKIVKQYEAEKQQQSGNDPSSGPTPEVKGETPSSIGANEDADTYMGRSLWDSLSREVSALRGFIDDPSDDDEEEQQKDSSGSTPQSPPQPDPSSFVIRGPAYYNAQASDFKPPSQAQVSMFCAVFLSNVDPLVKVLHRPSLWRYLHGETSELAGSPGAKGLHALRYAIFYAAATSLTDADCERLIGEERTGLLLRYRAEVESGLAKADFLNTEEMSTLQALIIFVYAVRANDSTRLTWTLISVAVRIGHALGLHREAASASRHPFRTNMRRCLWWQLCLFDSHSASDRGSDPLIASNSFNTKWPLHIDDEDLQPDSLQTPTEREGYTDMTFSLMCHEIFDTIRQLNFVPAGEAEVAHTDTDDSWAKRRDRVITCQRRIEDRYLRHCSMAIQVQRYTKLVGEVITAVMWLMAYRPLQRQANLSASRSIPQSRILELSVAVIERGNKIYADPASLPYRWQAKTWVMWHPMAVTLAELCIQTEGPLVDRSWAVVDAMFDEMAQWVADSAKGQLWRPVKKLMKKASQVRQSKSAEATAATGLTGLSMTPRPLDNTQQPLFTANDAHLDFDPNRQTSELSDSTAETLQAWPPQEPGTMQSMPFDWEPFLNATGTDLSLDSSQLDLMAWENWEGFVADFQDPENPSPPQNTALPIQPTSWG